MAGTTDALLRELTRLFAQWQREGVSCCGGTTATQCSLLTEIGRNGAMTLADLSRRVGLDKGWTSRAVETLVQDGLLNKVSSPADRRTVMIDLSPAGAARFADLNRMLNEQAERIMCRIPAPERSQVSRALELLAEALRAEVAANHTGPGRDSDGCS